MLAGPEEIAAAVTRLRAGGLVAFPTETVYGLGADALDAAAVERVFALKGRPATNPLIVHVSGVEMARGVVAEWSAEAGLLASRFWPGPLTLVLAKGAGVPGNVTAGGPNVGVRCPDHPTALALLEAYGKPLVGPSANPSGRISPTTAEHVRASFSEAEVLVLDGGACRVGIESTVVSLVGEARVLRPGVISAEEISAVLGRGVRVGSQGAGEVLESPGQLESHYAPVTRTVLCEAGDVGKVLASVERGVVISHVAVNAARPHRVIWMPADAAGYARGLYGALREADSAGAGVIVVVRAKAVGDANAMAVWTAIEDRLGRAKS